MAPNGQVGSSLDEALGSACGGQGSLYVRAPRISTATLPPCMGGVPARLKHLDLDAEEDRDYLLTAYITWTDIDLSPPGPASELLEALACVITQFPLARSWDFSPEPPVLLCRVKPAKPPPSRFRNHGGRFNQWSR